MNFFVLIMLAFALLGALDRIAGSRLGLGEQFEKGFMLLGPMALSMIGMISLSPVIAQLLSPAFDWVYEVLKLEPSIIPASLFANDMGGALLAKEIARDERLGMFNALVVSSMLGCTFSFNIPFALGVVEKEHHSDMFKGILCGIVTIPLGCFVSGLVLRIPLGALALNLLPLIIISALLAAGMLFAPRLAVKAFEIFTLCLKALITIGLAAGMAEFLTGKSIIPNLAPITQGAELCLNIAVVLSGALPLVFVLSKALARPIKKLGGALGINETSALGLVTTLVTNAATCRMMNEMDSHGIILNSAFLTSAAFTFGSHLAFTMAFDQAYILPVIIGKLTAGITALALAILIYRNKKS